ncbi:MAG: glycosyltransferase family 2 protein [Candidatus Nanopelagicales bacterium]
MTNQLHREDRAIFPPSPQPRGVSVIMTLLNEQRHLPEAIAAVQNQTWDGELQIVLALGPSTDDTDQIAQGLADLDPRVVLVTNPSGRTPAGLNAALAAVHYPVVVRVDGHSVLPSDYIDRAVAALERTGADNVGGVMAAAGVTDFERAAAVAMTSKLGVGAASFHVGGGEWPAESVYLGVFRRDTLTALGGYDDAFDRAQDWEMNHRIRELGGTVWFTPELRVAYRPRANVRALARQYFHYGKWRRELMRHHEGTASLRYLAAPAAVAAIVAGSAAGVLGMASPSLRFLRLGWLAPLGYSAAVVLGGTVVSRGEPTSVRLRVPLALAAMHCSWGVGFLTSPNDLRADRGESHGDANR